MEKNSKEYTPVRRTKVGTKATVAVPDIRTKWVRADKIVDLPGTVYVKCRVSWVAP